MTQIVSSISGFEIYAPSAGNAPTNSAEVSAIASAYQVVSSTATQLYGGSAYLTSVNDAPVSASRAGNAANASMANSAYYDGTGRLISSLPDSAAVSSIASSYAESAASAKLDKTAQVVTATAGDGMYVTSINGMGLSGEGGGGAQVVTATGSASATSGWYPYTTSYLVSSINGSALLPYGYSALSANSANWNSTRTTVINNSANWNSVYNTVSSNSAGWSGSTVVSPSGTIVVLNGNEIEGTNSAVLTANGEWFESTMYPQNSNIATYMQILTYATVPGTGGTLLIPLRRAAYAEIQVILSGMGRSDTGYELVSASGFVHSGDYTASIPMDGITGEISASAANWVDLSAGALLTARKDGGIVVTGVGELAWKSAVDNVTNTVAMHSADWEQGGLPASTVSSIASSYANSAASSKLDTTAFSTVSGTFLTAHQDLSDYQTVDGMTAYQPAGNYMTADALTGVSGTWDTVTGKLDTTAQVVTATAGDGTYVTSINGLGLSGEGGGVITATGSGMVSGTGISSLNGSSIIAKSLWTQGRIMIGSGDPGMYLTGSNNGGTAYYKSNEMVINRSSYGEQIKFNLGSAGSQVYGSASGQRGAFIQMSNDYHWAFLGALSGEDGIIELDGYSANSASMYAWDGVVDTVSTNSASWGGGGGVDSATVSSIASSYAESAASSKMDSSAMTSYALSADVSGTVDLVSTQSANWGGSALALSAGPGVKLEKVGDTLVVGADETVLWSGPSEWVSSGPTIAMSETLSNFERIGIYAAGYADSNQWDYHEIKLSAEDTANGVAFNIQGVADGYTFARFNIGLIFPRNGGSSLAFAGFKQFNLGTSVNTAQSPAKIQKIIGINRTAGV